MTGRLAIGIGCRRGCPASAILTLIHEACDGLDMAGAGLFTHECKRADPGLLSVATTLGLPITFLPAKALAAETDQITHRSDRVEALLGVPSVAEAAALAGAGPRSHLVVPRRAHAGATCAVAMRGGPTE